jgi:hypothetical protein
MGNGLAKWLILFELLVSVFGYLGWRWLRPTSTTTTAKREVPKETSAVPSPAVATDTKSTPVSFGYKLAWVAVRSQHAEQVIQALQLQQVQPCSWQQGVDSAYAQQVFVTPPIGEWTLVAGRSLPLIDNATTLRAAETLLIRLSREFGEAQYFYSNRIVETHGWLKAQQGQLVRAYVYNGEQGETLVSTGKRSTAEPATLVNTRSTAALRDPNYLDQPQLVTPSEELVMQVAAHWSIDPSELEARYNIPSQGGWRGYYLAK